MSWLVEAEAADLRVKLAAAETREAVLREALERVQRFLEDLQHGPIGEITPINY